MTRDFRASHPSRGIHDARLWFGVEVEGTRCGMNTAFIADELQGTEVVRLRSSRVEQWFFTETFRSWSWYLTHLDAPRPALVTAGVMAQDAAEFLKFRDSMLKHVRVIVRVFDAPWSVLLKSTDQVSVGIPYDMVTFGSQAGMLTKPYHYEKDRV